MSTPTSSSPAVPLPEQIERMTDAEVDALLVQLRARRLKAHEEYVEGERLRNEAKHSKMTERLSKHYDILGRDLARVNATLIKLEDRIAKVRAMKLELGIKFDID